MINELGNYQDETIISNIEKETKRNVLTFRLNSNVLEAKCDYK